MNTITEQHRQLLRTGCDQLQLELSETQFTDLIDYLGNLVKWNQAYNLTAIRDTNQMIIKHLLDSLAVAAFMQGDTLLDVGTGAGLPGIPLAILNPEHNWTLVDSNGKKTRFLLQMKATLNLENVQVVKGRVEAFTKNVQYDVIVSRAFTALSGFVGVCLPLLSQEGRLLAMKGQLPEAELATLDQSKLSIKVWPVKVPFLEEARHLIEVKPS